MHPLLPSSSGSCVLGNGGLTWELPAKREQECFSRRLAHALCPAQVACRPRASQAGVTAHLHSHAEFMEPGCWTSGTWLSQPTSPRKNWSPFRVGQRVSLVDHAEDGKRPFSPTRADQPVHSTVSKSAPSALSPGVGGPCETKPASSGDHCVSRLSAESGAHRV